LKITNGGTVFSGGVNIENRSLAVVNVGDGSQLYAFAITNDGVVRLRTVPAATAGTYMPIVGNLWAEGRGWQVLGGIWDSATHVMTVSPAAVGDTTGPVTIDRSTTQRVAITDGSSGASLWMALAAADFTEDVEAALMGTSLVSNLQGLLPQGGNVLAGWTVTAMGTNSPAAGLSVGIGTGYLTQGLAVWQWDGSAWRSFAATDLSSDGAYADFTVTYPGGYAVTTVPVGCNWNGASGNWSETGKWYPRVPVNGAPAGSSYDAVISGGVVTLDADANVNTLQLTGGTLAGAYNLTMDYGGTITGTYNVTGATTVNGGVLLLGGGVSHSIGGVAGSGDN
jgi:hypothetical protein